jgi:hypothetical protein
MTYTSPKQRQDSVFTAEQRQAAKEDPANNTSSSADLMTPKAAAAYIKIEASTLAMWRSTKRYALPYVKVGRLVFYRKVHLDAFLAARTVNSSGDLQGESANG